MHHGIFFYVTGVESRSVSWEVPIKEPIIFEFVDVGVCEILLYQF